MVEFDRGDAAVTMGLSKISSRRGSVLLITLVFVIILTTTAISVLELGLNTYRLTMRNQLRAEAMAVAESELEYLLYQFKTVVVSGNTARDTPELLAAANLVDVGSVPTTSRSPFLAAHAAAGWRVRRSLILDREPINGQIPNTSKVGTYTYIVARVEVIPPESSPFANSASVRAGRRFINSNTSIFQYSIFFQGNLELNPGTDTTINGDVVANGSIYLGPMAGRSLVLNSKVRYLADKFFNRDSEGATTYSNPDAPPPPVTLVAPTFAVSQDSQLETLSAPENLLGGIDATATAQDRPDLFGPAGRTDPTLWTEAEQAEAINNVYRSLIVPPPDAASSNEYPNASGSTTDDSVISVRRAYSRAELVVTVETDGSVSVTKIDEGVSSDVTSLFAGAITDFDSGAATDNSKPVYDQREGKNIAITEIDVAALKTTLDTLRAATDSSHFEFNGLLYVNLKNSSEASPAAVRLVNGTDLPRNGDSGFSVATNGGLYVKGSYNTNQIVEADGSTRNVPAMLIGDAITVLSSTWDDANASQPLTSRVAGYSAQEALDFRAQVNAGLLTGNQESTGSGSSGGAQNLVRYLENWSGKNVSFYGSLGRLFTSTQFVAAYTGPGSVYLQPGRSFSFDSDMLKHSPPGTPTTTEFGRGDFFTW